MKPYLVLFLFVVLLSISFAGQSQTQKILMVLSSHGENAGETQPGFEFDEFSKAYLVFKRHGLDIDVASPLGGSIEADKYDPNKSYNKAILSDPEAMNKLSNTLSTHSLKADDYNGIFIVGGKGAMFDLPDDVHLQKLIATIYENNGVVSAVCHGPAALVNVQLSNGQYLVENKRVNGFTNQEERAFGKKWVSHFDFLLQDKLIENGGKFEHSPMMLEHVAIDERLITGQNPFSTQATAEQLVKSLGITPIKVAPDIEQRTISLIARLLDGDQQAEKEYMASPKTFQTPLIGMYGYYQLQYAENKLHTEKAVNLMQLAGNFMNHPKLRLATAKGLQQLGQIEQAKSVLVALVNAQPELQEAKQQLAKLEEH